MSLNYNAKYPQGFLPGDANYPSGIPKNSTTETSEDGAPWDVDLIKDYMAFLQGLLSRNNISPSGITDTVNVSDFLDALGIEINKPFETLNDAVIGTNKTRIFEGAIVYIEERTAGNGGGAQWKFVAIGSVTPNTFNIVACTGINTLALVLINTRYPGALKIQEMIKPKQWGAQSVALGSLTGFDNSPVTQAIADHVTTQASGDVHWGNGAFYFASNVDIPNTDAGLGDNGIVFRGTGRKTTELFTDQDIDMFTHSDRLVVRDLSVVQRSAVTNKHKGVAFRANGQCRFCIFENVEIWWFKFGNLQRFSLWNSYRDIYYVDNSCGIKLARNNDMEDQTNPSPVGAWNAGDGWFHNQNTFSNILFNGGKETDGGKGEVGFWGAIQGNSFDNITAQNYERTGGHVNTTIPLGQVSTGMEIQGGGPSSTKSFGNALRNYYNERTFKALKVVDCAALSIDTWFVQGQAGGETMLEASNSHITIRGQDGQTAGFTNSVDLTNNSNVTFDKVIKASGAVQLVEAGSVLSQNGVPNSQSFPLFTTTIGTETSGTITLEAAEDQLTYKRVDDMVFITGRFDIASVSSPIGNFIEVENIPFNVAQLGERAGNGAGSCTAFISGVPASLPVLVNENLQVIRIYIDASTISTNDSFYLTMVYLTDE